MPSRVLLAIVALAVFVGACGSEDDPGVGESAAAQRNNDTDPELIVVPGPGGYSPDTLVECGGPPSFPARALVGPPVRFEFDRNDGAWEVLADFLGSGEGDWWPQDGYWVLENDERSLVLVHLTSDGENTWLGAELRDGNWQASRISSGPPCPIRVPLPQGLGEVRWRIDPARPVTAESPELYLLAAGESCSSGQPMGDRLLAPQVVLTEDVVYVALAAGLPFGDQTCPGNPDEPVTVDLGERLGDRAIVDARDAVGTIADFLPVSPCGQIDTGRLPVPDPTTGPVALDGPPPRVPC